jgi:hypothetical protein
MFQSTPFKASSPSTVVEQSTLDLKFEGLNPAAAGTGRRKHDETLFILISSYIGHNLRGVGKTTSLLSARFRHIFIAIKQKNSGK